MFFLRSLTSPKIAFRLVFKRVTSPLKRCQVQRFCQNFFEASAIFLRIAISKESHYILTSIFLNDPTSMDFRAFNFQDTSPFLVHSKFILSTFQTLPIDFRLASAALPSISWVGFFGGQCSHVVNNRLFKKAGWKKGPRLEFLDM